VHTCNPRTQEAEAGELKVPGFCSKTPSQKPNKKKVTCEQLHEEPGEVGHMWRENVLDGGAISEQASSRSVCLACLRNSKKASVPGCYDERKRYRR
jgi:hypothetical protein